MIDQFTKKEFEIALARILDGKGQNIPTANAFEDGEWVYTVPISDFAQLKVRSSIGNSGMAADSGEDSIRIFLEVKVEDGSWRGSKKIGAWTTRQPGWANRMADKMRELWNLGSHIKTNRTFCTNPKCAHKLKGMWITASGKNAGRPAEKCFNCNDFASTFRWLDKADPLKAVVVKSNDTNKNQSTDPTTAVRGSGNGFQGGGLPQIANTKTESNLPIEDEDYLEEEMVTVSTKPRIKAQPNAAQLEFIEAPVDANIRCLAGPGSGKTFAIELRNVYLLKNGVDSKHILNVTFSKDMAESGKNRVLATIQDAVKNGQLSLSASDLEEFESWFCTIHAACYRILKREGDKRRVPKTWQIKKRVKEIAEKLWPVAENRPGWEELMAFINLPKRYGLSSAEDMAIYRQIRDNDGNRVGEKLHLARVEYDKFMQVSGFLGFVDMMYDVEQRLVRDKEFREKWQEKFQTVLADEAQDITAQAMRILSTLSLEPGDNRVYENWNPVKDR